MPPSIPDPVPHGAAGASAAGSTPLVGLERSALQDVLIRHGEAPEKARMRASQIWRWLYGRGACSFTEMSNLPQALRTVLSGSASLTRPQVVDEQQSDDGTIKWLLRLPGGQEVESVFIPESDRGALCVSTQVGCSLTCSFCHTGTMPLVRNLKAGEIVGQILTARDRLGEWPAPAQRRLSHIVVMGMGEPLLNYEATAAALRIAMDDGGLAFPRRKITLSTSGIVPLIDRAAAELGTGLAVSLHAPRDDLRDELVPINRKWPIAELLGACRRYADRHGTITFEYVMLDGVNDGDDDARRLVGLLQGVPAKVNLIPFNPWPGSAYRCSPLARIRRFAEIVTRSGVIAPVRTPRGRDILAACGQLKTASERRRRRLAA
jgi:23S rRNA (adenine2503-C2)-methyltransferase